MDRKQGPHLTLLLLAATSLALLVSCGDGAPTSSAEPPSDAKGLAGLDPGGDPGATDAPEPDADPLDTSTPAGDTGPPDGGDAEGPPPDVEPPPPEPDPCVASDALLARVDPARMLADLQVLVGFEERSTWESQQAVADYIIEQLTDIDGFEVTEHTYTLWGKTWVNVEATLTGALLPDEFVLMGAHYDSTSEQAQVASPGADDDASGVVALLETARVFGGCAPRRSIRLVFFSNEEVGTIGSEKYVADLPADIPVEKLLLYVNVDMIAYGPDSEDLDLATRPAYSELLDDMADTVTEWTSLEVKKHIDDHCG